MRITTGGTLGFKMIANPYEPIDINATFLVEEDIVIVGEDADSLIELLNNKANKILEEQLKKKANIAVKVYKEARNRLKEIDVGY